MEEKKIEQLQHELEEVKNTGRKRNDFLQQMSHEIRTPLNAIIGLSYLSKECDSMPEKVYENLSKIEQSAHYLLSFVNDILSLSELEAGKIALEPDVVEAKKYFEGLVCKIREMALEKQIRFSAELCEALDKEYVFDAEKLSKALGYLSECAIKATPAGSTMSLTVQQILESEKEAVFRLALFDSGLEIEEEMLRKVFEPFTQIYGESRTLYSGSGLELTIAKSIIDLMKGTISAESKKGEGTRFAITISLKKEHRREKPSKELNDAKTSCDFAGKRVLVVEDNAINIEIARNILLHKQFEVEVVWNGQEAVEAFLNHEAGYYDVIFMDIRMPVLDGLEAAGMIRKLSRRPDGAEIPIIAMTANAFEEDVKKSFEAGMNGHLSKPIDIKKMCALLSQVLS